MKKYFCFVLLLALTQISFSQKKWATNFGFEVGTDGMFGLVGVTPLKPTDNPLVQSNNVSAKYAVAAGFYAEFLQLRKRADSKWGSTAPSFGIKTKLDWQFFRADNSSDGGGESFGLNYANVPVLFEYCLGYHQGVTRASRTPGTTTYNGVENSDGSFTVTERSTSGTYNPGGQKTSTGTFIYFGPQISYLFKSFNYTGDPIKDANLKNTYVGVVGGFTFCTHKLNFDLSYQQGITSIYNGKNVTVNGFMLRIGVNFGNRLYN
ncbi:MAG: hypothetical protein Q8891_08735 [Bacteroidota bacterium]|nr:hypothetical protein [Bacteroidota bacterium]